MVGLTVTYRKFADVLCAMVEVKVQAGRAILLFKFN